MFVSIATTNTIDNPQIKTEQEVIQSDIKDLGKEVGDVDSKLERLGASIQRVLDEMQVPDQSRRASQRPAIIESASGDAAEVIFLRTMSI